MITMVIMVENHASDENLRFLCVYLDLTADLIHAHVVCIM